MGSLSGIAILGNGIHHKMCTNNIVFSSGFFNELNRLTKLIYYVSVDRSILYQQDKVTFHYGNSFDINQTVKLISTISKIQFSDKMKEILNYAASLNIPTKPVDICINIRFSGHEAVQLEHKWSKYALKEDVLKEDKIIGEYTRKILQKQ